MSLFLDCFLAVKMGKKLKSPVCGAICLCSMTIRLYPSVPLLSRLYEQIPETDEVFVLD